MARIGAFLRRAAAWLALGLASACASAEPLAPLTFGAMNERLAGQRPTGLQGEITERIKEARARGDRRAELHALRDRLWLAGIEPTEGDVPAQVEQTLARARAAGDIEVEASMLVEQALATERRDEAESLFKRAVALAERSGNRDLMTDVFEQYGGFSDRMHRADVALDWLERALDLATRDGQRAWQAVILTTIAGSLRSSDFASPADLAKSERYLHRALGLLDAKRYRSVLAEVDTGLGMVYSRTGRLDEARAMFEGALPLYGTDDTQVAVIEFQLARLATRQGRLVQARTLFERGARARDTEIALRSRVQLARIDAQLGNPARAMQALVQLRTAVDQLGVPDFQAEYQAAQAEIAARAGDWKLAYESAGRQFEIEKSQLTGSAARRAEELGARFDSKLKDADNQLLRAERAEAESRRTVLLLALAIAALLIVGILWFFVQQFRQRRRFEILALRDELTGAPNRRSVLEHIRRERLHAAAAGKELVVAILDIDFFKAVNDVYGHDAGDAVLKQFYATCATTLRPEDMLGRWGGEEFVLLTRATTVPALNALFQRLLASSRGMQLPELKGERVITFSMGACRVPADSNVVIDTLLARADGGLYAAKQAGRACWRMAGVEGEPSAAPAEPPPAGINARALDRSPR